MSLPQRIKDKCYQDVDGFWYYDPWDKEDEHGRWSEYDLRQLADYLAKMNEKVAKSMIPVVWVDGFKLFGPSK